MRIMSIVLAGLLVLAAGTAVCGEQADLSCVKAELADYYGFGEMEIVKLDWDIRDLKIADFDGDGRNDIAAANNTKSRIDILLQRADLQAEDAEVIVNQQDAEINRIESQSHFKRQSVAVSASMTSMVCGDLNGDSKIDLAFYGEPRGLYVLTQKGDEEGQAKAQVPAWNAIKKIQIDDGLVTGSAVACADLNNDGRCDLALAAQKGVYIVTQKEDGTLGEPVKYACSEQILGIEAADMNGDGVKDLMVLTADGKKPIRARFGVKSGRLGPERQFFVEMPTAAVFADLDAKAGDEMVMVDARSGRLICYGLKEGIEKSAGAEEWPILYYPMTAGSEESKRDLVAGDVDGDGLTDVVISQPGAAEIILYKQNKGEGLSEPKNFPSLSDITSMAAADVDKDGKCEIATLSVKERMIGLSRFDSERLTFPKSVDFTGEPVAMDLADADGDGNIDCVYVSRDANDVRSLRVTYNLAGEEKSENAKVAKKKAKKGDKQAQAGVLELKKLSANPDGLKVFDFDHDGLQDVLIFVKYETATVVRQVKKGVFEQLDSGATQGSLLKDAAQPFSAGPSTLCSPSPRRR